MSRVRDHWSIGEVLSLLQDEFPEVTISKIRFLESQGLIDPERTPSGYRKFSDADYDRLYWILEQQRDHYLPLRVIRDRLDEGQEIAPAPRRSDARIGDEIDDDEVDARAVNGGPDASTEVAPVPPQPPEGYESDAEPTFAQAMAGREGPVSTTDPTERHPVKHAEANALAAVMADQPGTEADGTEADQTGTEADQTGTEADGTEADQTGTEADGTEAGQTGTEADQTGTGADGTEADQTGTGADGTEADQTGTGADRAGTGADQAGTGAEPPPLRKAAPRLLGTRTEPPRPVTKSPSEALAPPPRPSLPGSSVALTHEELAQQSGSTPVMVAELEKHGLISPRRVGSAILFDSTALTIARLAVQFGRYGLEPRHLRTFRLGAEREVALLTQSIGPTLKANNPETRRRSFDTLQDLAELAASLRSIIVRDLVADLEPG